jgi:hypothetical protein
MRPSYLFPMDLRAPQAVPAQGYPIDHRESMGQYDEIRTSLCAPLPQLLDPDEGPDMLGVVEGREFPGKYLSPLTRFLR